MKFLVPGGKDPRVDRKYKKKLDGKSHQSIARDIAPFTKDTVALFYHIKPQHQDLAKLKAQR